MNIEDALLTRRLLRALTGCPGKTHPQLANECRVGQRRMTNLIFCLEKAGLVTTHDSGRVTLADELAGITVHHGCSIGLDENRNSPALTPKWKTVAQALDLQQQRGAEFVQRAFNNIFGGVGK